MLEFFPAFFTVYFILGLFTMLSVVASASLFLTRKFSWPKSLMLFTTFTLFDSSQISAAYAYCFYYHQGLTISAYTVTSIITFISYSLLLRMYFQQMTLHKSLLFFSLIFSVYTIVGLPIQHLVMKYAPMTSETALLITAAYCLLTCLATFAVTLLLYKLRVIKEIMRLTAYPKVCYVLGFLFLCSAIGPMYFVNLQSASITGFESWFIVFLVLATAVVFAITLFFSKRIQKQEQLLYTEEQIAEQLAYSKQLELIQLDLRKIQHDYKNMISAIYAHAENGDTTAVSHYIEKNLLSLNQEIQQNLQQLEQLTQLEHGVLKNLLLTKLKELEHYGYQPEMNIPKPIPAVPLPVATLQRCLDELFGQLSYTTETTNQLALAIDYIDNRIIQVALTASTTKEKTPSSDFISFCQASPAIDYRIEYTPNQTQYLTISLHAL